jgi:nicotinic acid phosphoribosyltransferase
MPAIRIIWNVKDPKTGQIVPGKEEWLRIFDERMDKDGYLQLFTIIEAVDGKDVPRAVHLVRHDVSMLGLAADIFGMGTTLRSAKGLMEDLAKLAKKEKWAGRAGAVGMAFASAAMLQEFLESRPFDKEGYYKSDGTLFLGRKIHSKTRGDYDPRQSDRD